MRSLRGALELIARTAARSAHMESRPTIASSVLSTSSYASRGISTTVSSELPAQGLLGSTWASGALARTYKQFTFPAAALALFSKAVTDVAKPVPHMSRQKIVHTDQPQNLTAAAVSDFMGGIVEGCIELPAADLADSMTLVKRTYQPGTLVRKRRHGFLKRMADKNGRNVLKRRLLKGRRKLAA
eukprot:858481-Prorocentrum_minimum.AAC.2